MDLALRRLALPFFLFPGLLPLALIGCSEGYSANTYAAAAAQQEATVQRGVIIGVRPVLISADGAIGAAAGGAAGGVAGAQLSSDNPVTTAFGAVGGAVLGGLGGAAAEQAIADAKGWEYIVQETSEKLVSVTQTSKKALPIGLYVLVIDGKQARIVPDYTVQTAAASPAAKAAGSAAAGMKPAITKASKTAAASNGATATPIQASPLLPAVGAAGPLKATPVTTASGSHRPVSAESGFCPSRCDAPACRIHDQVCPGRARSVDFHSTGKRLLSSHALERDRLRSAHLSGRNRELPSEKKR